MRNSTMNLSEKPYLHHCSFRSEKNLRTGDKLITLIKKVCCQLSPFFTRTSTGRPVYEPNSDLSQKRKSERIRILIERQKEQILAEVRSEIQKHELQADSRVWPIHAELRARFQELQNEVICMNDSRDFKDAVRTQWTIPRSQSTSGSSTLSWTRWIAKPQQSAARYLEFAGYIGKRFFFFANPLASSSSPYPGGFNPWISDVTEDTPVLTSTVRPVTCGERRIPDTVLTPRFQSGPSAGNSLDPQEVRFSKKKKCRPPKTADLGTSFWQIP